MSKALDAATLAVKLYEHASPEWRDKFLSARAAQDAIALIRLSASLRGIHVCECNGYTPGLIGQEQERRDRQLGKRLWEAVTLTLAPYRVQWKHNTDPRGAAVGILFSDGSYNTMGGAEEGWRI